MQVREPLGSGAMLFPRHVCECTQPWHIPPPAAPCLCTPLALHARQVVEFVRRSNDPLLGRLALQLPMIAYPVVSLKKVSSWGSGPASGDNMLQHSCAPTCAAASSNGLRTVPPPAFAQGGALVIQSTHSGLTAA
jgi:hypothetical protein